MTILRFEKTGEADGRVYVDEVCVAEIRRMSLANLRLSRTGAVVIGEDVPLPLFWRQYAHHEDPRRNGGSNARISEIPAGEGGALRLQCEGTNDGGEISSAVTADFSLDPTGGIVVVLHAVLVVRPGKTWAVTYNPSHGELEFCNVWPEGVFTTRSGRKKSYAHCFVERPAGVTLIPHTHIGSSDKQNIRMEQGDRFGWLLEEENPVVELLSDRESSAGLCAYMWDAHFGYRACHAPGTTTLPAGSRHEASVRISRISRAEGEALMSRGVRDIPEDALTAPLYIEGVNTFRDTLLTLPESAQDAWPWDFEATTGDREGSSGELDWSHGYDDTRSLRISCGKGCAGRWIASTLGPAFGGPPFPDGKMYRLSAFVSSLSLEGTARLGVRIHRKGTRGLGDTHSYDLYLSENKISGTTAWTPLEIITPQISPPPDRVHLLLEQAGEGTSWFDNVLFETYG